MGNEEQEIIVNVNVTELNEIVMELKDSVESIERTYNEQIVPSVQHSAEVQLSINTCCVTICAVLLGTLIYDYCKRIFKKKSIK